MKKYIVILAGGSGKRLGHEIPKQFIEIEGLPIIMHTINRFTSTCNNADYILALNEDHLQLWKNLCNKYSFKFDGKIVKGGKERFFSSRNALNAIEDNFSITAIHDAVRPFITKKVIEEGFLEAQQHDAVVPVMPVIPTIRKKLINDANLGVDRDNYFIVQTPQIFKTSVIKKAYQLNYHHSFHDDATVAESIGTKINLIKGNEENVKITTRTDLLLAKNLINITL